MSTANSSVDAKEPETEGTSQKQEIEDVYIGVFFDGTNNNMLWTAKDKIKKYRDKLNTKNQNNLSNDDIEYINELSEDKIDIIIKLNSKEYKGYLIDLHANDDIKTKKEFIKNKKKYTKIDIETAIAESIVDNHTIFTDKDECANFVKLQLSKEDICRALKKGNHHNCKDCKIKSYECDFLSKTDDINEWIFNNYKDNKNFLDAIRQYKNAHTKYKPTKCGGFSNIAILYSTYNPEPHKKQSKQYKIYIEGSGATDIAEKGTMNINGLGFGLGETGVVALVSKAVFYVNNYVESIKSNFKDKKVNIHFNVFGFSRGATCSRLFAYLVTRKVDDNLGIREKEFADFYAKKLYFKKDEGDAKLHFLEDPKYNKTVDFLGIYDTVVSIGFLLQKDGYVNPLAWLYKNNLVDLLADNYKENWHCNNVSEYGMYSTSSEYLHKNKIKNILHICAMDEYRENFALTDVGMKVGENALEVFIPGCHSDVGGGYYDGDEEQEIILYKKIERGDDLEPKEWNERRKSDMLKNRKDRNKQNDTNDKSSDKSYIDNNINSIYQSFYENNDVTQDNLLKSLIYLGWIDKDWKDDLYRQKIYLNGNEEPCTLRITDGPKYVKFKRNVKAGYSNIPLKMMITYAENKMQSTVPVPNIQFSKLFDTKYIEKEYPIPLDLKTMSDNMISEVNKAKTEKRLWIHPNEDIYKKLRMKYLHFTSTYRLFHVSKPENGVRWNEGSLGNIANTPNQDLDGRICRIVYHGDNDDYSINYMYDYDAKKDDKKIIDRKQITF